MNGVGKLGEDYMAEELIKNGYKILARNYNTRFGEIDIVAENEGFIAFVEVKARSVGSLYNPAEAVTMKKQQKIILAAQEFLQRNHTGLQPRFDVAALKIRKDEVESFTYIKNAFTL